MKKIIFIITLVLLLKPVFPVVEYVVNYDYISKVLCENKEKPKLQCNGKCHLMKELAKASDSDITGEKPISSDKKMASLEFEVLFFEVIQPFKTFYFYSVNKKDVNSNYSNLYAYLDSCSQFHPPAVIS